MNRRFVLATALLSFQSVASAQYILERFTGISNSNSFGFRVAMVGDVDGDGYSDPIVSGTSSGSTQYVRLFSGRTGALIRQHTSIGIVFGNSLGAAGDIDGDGAADYFVGAPDEPSPTAPASGSVRIFSGATGSLLRTYWGEQQADRLGQSAANIGDINGDGFDEIVGGAYLADVNGTNSGQATVFSGADGAVLFRLFGENASAHFGFACGGCGDVDADGVPDFIVGAPHIGAAGGPRGYARVFSGATGAVLHAFLGAAFQDRFGVSVAGAGDVNGDGHADLIVGAEQESFGFNHSGSATILSGADGSVLFKRGGGSSNAYASIVAGGFDYDGDGFLDVAVGSYNENVGAGAVRVYRGVDGALIQQINGEASSQLGLSVASAGDYDRNGADDLLIGAFGAREARVYSRDDCVFERLCTSTPNSVGVGAAMEHVGVSSVSTNNLTLLAEGLPPNSTCVCYFGSAVLSVPYFDGVRCASGQVVRLPARQSDSFGDVSFPIDHNSGSALIDLLAPGSTWTFQVVYRDAGFGAWGVNTSDALRIGFCP